MVLLVRLRQTEIGIRRAVGARRSDIIRQFLFEAGFMSSMGGLLGIVAAMAVCIVIYRVGDFPFVIDPLLIAGALAGSAAIGVVAGAYPAWQAARVEILAVLQRH